MTTEEFWGTLIGGLVVGCVIGLFVGSGISDSSWEHNTIRHHAAQYNTQTGDFEWLEEAK